MNCKVSRSRLSGEIICPANKSYTHRAVFVASLASGTSTIRNALRSADTDATIRACQKIGAEISGGKDLVVCGTGGKVRPASIDAANSGTTIRIAAAIAGLAAGESVLTGDASLRQRPMGPLLEALGSAGAACSSDGGRPPVTIRGTMDGGRISIPGGISSQFVSALLIAAPLTGRGMTIRIDGELVSRPYLDATIATMNGFGATIRAIQKYKEYSIPRQAYTGTDFSVPSDHSSLALLLCAAILAGGDLAVRTCNNSLPQGDSRFVGMLGELGATIKEDGDLTRVRAPEMLSGGSFDLGDTPDLLPPLAVLALKSDSPIEIRNAGHARLKETDRIAIICRELSKLGLAINERDDGMELSRTGSLAGASLESGGDHRLFMAFCAAAMYVGGCTVSDAECAAVSYPDFIREMRGAGAKLSLAP